MRVENITPYDSAASKHEQIKEAFNAIAPRYDRLNRVLSLGIDIGWRKRALRYLSACAPARVLDVATGTADMAIMAAQALPTAFVEGIDLSGAMIAIGRAKIERTGVAQRVKLLEGDALSLPFADGSFDAVISAFGVRNFADITTGLREMRRVLKPGGLIVILELSRPERFPMRQLFRVYMRFVMPLMSRMFSRHKREYRYLPASIMHVPQGAEMLAMLRAADFVECERQKYTGGVCSCYIGRNGTCI